MVKGSGDPIVVHDTSDAFTRRSHSKSSSQWRNFLSPKLKDMYERPRESTDDLDSEDEKMDIRKILKEIEYLGSSHMSWKEKKQMENRNVVTLGGKPPKSHRVPLSVAKVTMKKQKEREQKMSQEGMILGKYGTHGNSNKRVEKRKADDPVLRASEGHFKNGILNVKHLLGGSSSSRKDDTTHKVSRGKKKKGKGRKGEKKGKGRKGEKKHR